MKSTLSLKDNRVFRRMYRCKNFAVSPYFVVYAKRNNLSHNRLGLTVSVKLGGAVVRNKIKRRIREVYRLNESAACASGTHDIVIVARKKAVDGDFRSMERWFLKSVARLGLCRICDIRDALVSNSSGSDISGKNN